MFQRKIINDLKKWANSSDRKPLIIRGARQVGKTTLVNLFSSNFDQYIYLNLEKNQDKEIFSRNLNLDDLIQAIFLNKRKSKINGKTLLFIDEIQNSPEAISYLRYFYEEKKDIYVIAAGSLLEIMMGKKQISFPVGRVQFIYLYPLNFSEFLIAMNENQAFDLYNKIPIPEFALETLFELYHKYTLIGGMPEIVANYSINKNISELAPIYDSLLTSFKDDVGKYARNESMIEIIKHTIEKLPVEAGKRIKFEKFGNSHYKSREMGEALRVLERAMLINLVYPVTSTNLPLIPDEKKSPKLDFIDTGLINYSCSIQDSFFKTKNIQSFYNGIISEHIVSQELQSLNSISNKKTLFWVREKNNTNSQVDFVLPYKTYLIPIEVKSGKTGSLRSLHQFMNRASHQFAVRLYYGKISIDDVKTVEGKNFKLLNLPYFLTGKIFEYLDWFVEETE